jgi:hypothetical protein
MCLGTCIQLKAMSVWNYKPEIYLEADDNPVAISRCSK